MAQIDINRIEGIYLNRFLHDDRPIILGGITAYISIDGQELVRNIALVRALYAFTKKMQPRNAEVSSTLELFERKYRNNLDRLLGEHTVITDDMYNTEKQAAITSLEAAAAAQQLAHSLASMGMGDNRSGGRKSIKRLRKKTRRTIRGKKARKSRRVRK